MRGAVANGRGHEKIIFVEPVPNEVLQFLSSVRSLAHDRPRLALPTLVDIRTSATEHGVFSALVGDTSFTLGTVF